MNQKTAGERKRTVTITLGPLSLAQIELLALRCTSAVAPVPLTVTDMVGSAVTTWLVTCSKALGVKVPEGLLTHFD